MTTIVVLNDEDSLSDINGCTVRFYANTEVDGDMPDDKADAICDIATLLEEAIKAKLPCVKGFVNETV